MKNLLLLIICSFLFACVESPETQYEKNGISFTVPAGWKITEEENIEGKGYYLSCEKEGLSQSGLVMITFLNDSFPLEDMVESHKTNFKENYIFKHADVSFTSNKETTFNGSACVSSEYNLTLLKVPHHGIINCFYGNGKTISIVIQAALEDSVSTNKGINRIIKTFKCK
jgi:hypothetical protein